MFRGGRSDRGHGRGRGGFDSPRGGFERGGLRGRFDNGRGNFDNTPRGGRGGGFGSREDIGGPTMSHNEGDDNFGGPARGSRGFTPRGRGGGPDGPFQRSEFESSNVNQDPSENEFASYSNQPRGGFTPRGRGSGSFENRGRGGFDNDTWGGSRGGFDNNEGNNDSFGDFGSFNQGGFGNSARGGNANRGGFDNNTRGGFENNFQRGGFDNKTRGGFDKSNPVGSDGQPQNSFENSNRGGFENSNRGGFDNSNRGAFDKKLRGGFDSNFRGGFENSSPRGGFDGNYRGGFKNSPGGSFEDNSRKGFDTSFPGEMDKGNPVGSDWQPHDSFESRNRAAGFDNSPGGFENSSRGGFDNNSRGGFDNRGRGRGSFENKRGGPPQIKDQFQTESFTNFDQSPNYSRGGGFTPRGRGFNQNANESNQRGGFELGGQRGGRGDFGSSPRFGRDPFNDTQSPTPNVPSVGGPQNQNQRSGFSPAAMGRGFPGPGAVKEEPEPSQRAPAKEERGNRVSRFGPPVVNQSSSTAEGIKAESPSSLPSSSKIECEPCNAQFTNNISYR